MGTRMREKTAVVLGASAEGDARVIMSPPATTHPFPGDLGDDRVPHRRRQPKSLAAPCSGGAMPARIDQESASTAGD